MGNFLKANYLAAGASLLATRMSLVIRVASKLAYVRDRNLN